MRGYAHSLLSTSCGVTLAFAMYSNNMPIENCVCLAAGCSFGGLLPDIDTPTSRMGRNFPIISHLCNFFFKHRGILHTPLAAVILSLLMLNGLYLSKIFIPITIGFFLGYMLHLLQDSFTPRSIAWLYPFSKKKWRFMTFKVNFLSEILISGAIFLAFLPFVGIFYMITSFFS